MWSLITRVGGPEGYINTNPVQAARSQNATIGLMRMPVGNRRAGVHVHSVTEIYVILKGAAECFDGVGNLHRAGPMDCLYIPRSVPHGVRSLGDTDLELIWLHDAIERNGVSVYLDGPGPFAAEDEVRLISFRDLVPDWGQAEAKMGGTRRWVAHWVAATGAANHNPGVAQVNETLALGVTAILPGNTAPAHEHAFAETYIIIAGTAGVRQADRVEHLGRLDAVRFEPGTSHAVRNTGDQTLYLLWAHEKPGA